MFGQLPVPMNILLRMVSTYCKSAPGICHIIYNNSDTPAKMNTGMFWATNDIDLVSLSYLFWYVLMQIIKKQYQTDASGLTHMELLSGRINLQWT